MQIDKPHCKTKKIILLPNTDTAILCLPEAWIGVPIMCRLTPIYSYHTIIDEVEIEKLTAFRYKKRKKKNM